jgi:hypothetical protein
MINETNTNTMDSPMAIYGLPYPINVTFITLLSVSNSEKSR